MPTVPLFGSGVTGKSANVTAQRRINLYSEKFGDADKAATVYYGRPGLVQWLTSTGSGYGSGPWRGIFAHNVGSNSHVIGAQGSGSVLSVLQKSVLASGDGFLRTTTGFVDFAVNYTSDYVYVDGVSFYNGTYDFLTEGTAGAFPFGATSICCVAQRYVVNDPSNPGRFYWSDVGYKANVSPAWDALDYATAESAVDGIIAVRECRGELLLFGTESIEFWAPSGDASVFARVGGSGIGWGLASQTSVQKWNDGMIFLGRNALGERQVCLLNGYQVAVISNPDVEKRINDAPSPDASSGMCMTIAGHSFYVLNLTDTSVVFDLTTGEWAEWQTDGGRWAGQYGCAAWGGYLVTDYRDSRVYLVDSSVLADDDEPIVREITSRHLFSNLDRVTVSALALDVEVGVGLEEGQGSDPQVMLQVSRDGGHTWGNEIWRSLGALGDYARRVVWNRLGRARDFVFRFRVTDPVKVTLLGASVEVEK